MEERKRKITRKRQKHIQTSERQTDIQTDKQAEFT